MKPSKPPLFPFLLAASLVAPWGYVAAYEPDAPGRPAVSQNASVVTLLAFDSAGKTTAQGIAFFVGNAADVVTSLHLLEGAVRLEVVALDKKVYPSERVVSDDPDADLVRLSTRVPVDMAHPLALRTGPPVPGEKVLVMVSPLMVSDGEISEVRTVPELGGLFKLTAPLSAAASGSPVVDASGEVVGMATVVTREGEVAVVGVAAGEIGRLKPGTGLTISDWRSRHIKSSAETADKAYADAVVCLWIGNLDRSVQLLGQCVKQAPGNAKAYRLIAYCYEKLGRPKDQGDALQQLVRINPRDLQTYYDLAVLYGSFEYYAEVVDILENALKVNKDYYQGFAYMGWAYAQMDSLDMAVKMGKKAIALKPDYDQGHLYLGMTYSLMGQREWALNAYQQALRINPENADAHFQIAFVYAQQPDYLKELASLKEAVRLSPDNAEMLARLGKAYLYHVGNYGEAVAALKRALAVRPGDADTQYELGIAYVKSGDVKGARGVGTELARTSPKLAQQLQAKIPK